MSNLGQAGPAPSRRPVEGSDLRARALGVFAMVLGALAFSAAPALAVISPVVTIKAVGTVTSTTAKVSGTVNPNASPTTTAWDFQYSKDPETEGWTPAVSGIAVAAEEVTGTIEGLQPSASYQVRLVAANEEGGEGVSAEPNPTLTTEPAPPQVEFETAYPSATGATLEAYVNADNQEVTKCEFEYGTEPSLATSTAVGCEPGALPGLYGPQAVVVGVTGLQADRTYYFKVSAENIKGEKATEIIEHFTTAPEVPTTLKPEPVTGMTATLKGVLNPGATLPGEAETYEFLYKQSPTECQGENEKTAPAPMSAALGHEHEAVQAPVSGLLPDTTYTFCLLARNVAGQTALSSPPETFTTPVVEPIVEAESASEVSATEARLQATIDPGGLETSYHFEYGPAAGSYDVSIPVTAREIAAGVSGVSVNVVATGLQPGTIYHYRVVASNSQSPAGETPGPDETFTTLAAQGAGTPGSCGNEQARTEQPYGQALPDCRAYEMVSPLDKSDNDISFAGSRAAVSSESPALSYSSHGSFAEPQGAPQQGEYLARREPEQDRWSSQNISPPRVITETETQTPFDQLLFTPSLSAGVVLSLGVPLVEDEPAGFDNLFVADLASTPVSYQAVSNIGPEVAKPYKGEALAAPAPMGVSTDLSHVVFQAPDNLTKGAAGPGAEQDFHIYEWAEGKLSQVDISPTGMQFEYYDEVGAPDEFSSGGDTWHAVSANGLRVFFTAAAQFHTNTGQLYVRENPMSPIEDCSVSGDACTVEVSKSQKTNGTGPEATQPAYYRDASANGERVFFTSRAELTNNANTGESDDAGNLYEYDLETKELIDLTVPATAMEKAEDPEGAAVLGLVTASENAGEENSYVYFVANGVLAENENANEETAQAGNCKKEEAEVLAGVHTCSLYVAHYKGGKWETKFVATLAGGVNAEAYDYSSLGDEKDWVGHEGGILIEDDGPETHTVRVTPDGATLAFESERSLTGYDNEPVEPGGAEESGGTENHHCTETGAKPQANNPAAPCREVYLYDAVTGKLVCASCDPSGARPVDSAELGGREESAGSINLRPSAFYLPRNLSEDGERLFFQSRDPLVPHDSNGKLDVYEWEASGQGGCNSPQGCVDPISDVAGKYESHFMDASADGDDVFIDTADQLVSSDTDSREDVYDVRVGGGFPVSTSPPVCDNGDSCKAPASPQPGVFGAPASAIFSGPGNLTSPPPTVVKPKPMKKTVRCKRGFTKNKKGQCVKKRKSKQRRVKKSNRRGH